MSEHVASGPTPDERTMVAEVAAVIRKHVRLEWHGNDHADINLRSTAAAAEEIVRQINLAIRSFKPDPDRCVDEQTIEVRVGGAYRMQDGRTFWIDKLVAQEIARRALGAAA